MDEQKFAPPIVQCLTGLDVWAKLTTRQRELVAGCWDDETKRVTVDKLTDANPRTIASLRSKDVVDERGWLTEIGVYTAKWNPTRRIV